MKKVIGISLLIMSINANAVCAKASSGYSSAHSSESSHVAEESTIARTQTANVIMATNNASAIARQQEENQQQVINHTSIITENMIPKGVLVCKTYETRDIPNGALFNSCDAREGMGREMISIDEFFRRYKPSDATKITMIIYNRSEEVFEIYYN